MIKSQICILMLLFTSLTFPSETYGEELKLNIICASDYTNDPHFGKENKYWNPHLNISNTSIQIITITNCPSTYHLRQVFPSDCYLAKNCFNSITNTDFNDSFLKIFIVENSTLSIFFKVISIFEDQNSLTFHYSGKYSKSGQHMTACAYYILELPKKYIDYTIEFKSIDFSN